MPLAVVTWSLHPRMMRSKDGLDYFLLHPKKALEHIELHRHDITRMHVSDDHWEFVREKMERRGHSKDSYEHQLTTKMIKPSTKNSQPLSTEQARTMYLLKLDGPLNAAEIVQTAANLILLVGVVYASHLVTQ